MPFPNPLDIIIPTLKSREDVAAQVAEITETAGCPVNVIATCQHVSAAANRNIGLDQSTSDPLIMLDDDMEQFPLGWAVRLADVLLQTPHAVMASPQLAKPDGTPGPMMGGVQIRQGGVTRAAQRKLPTACIAIRRNSLRFDESFLGSGFEDDDYCAQLRAAHPNAEFLVCHDVWIVHRNEMKNQHGPNWERNKRYFERKWDVVENKHQ